MSPTPWTPRASGPRQAKSSGSVPITRWRASLAGRRRDRSTRDCARRSSGSKPTCSITGPVSTRFEPGGPVSGGGIPLSVPLIGGNAWAYVKQCLDDGWVSSAGPFVTRFEQEVAARSGRAHGVACASGTAAIHLALIVAGVEANDEVIVPALTFAAPANAVRYIGAWPVFIDVEPDFWQIDPARLKDFVERGCDWRDGALINRATGRRVRAVLPVDLLGHPVDMDAI